MPESPALETDEQAIATLAETHGWPPPSRYSSVAEEYEALHTGVALLDRSYVGRLSFTGEDALDLLNRLSTNDLMGLEVGKGTPTVLTSNKGRILDLIFVLRLADHLLVLTGPENRHNVVEWINLYTFSEDVTIQDITEETAMLSVAGPEAAGLLDMLTGMKVSSLGRHESLHAGIAGLKTSVVRTDFARLPGYDLVVPADDGRRLWNELLEEGETVRPKPVGTEALELVRVEQGVPAYGKELSEDYNPLEANLLEFISFTKGCYIGQEVVARLQTYQKVQKRLVGLMWDSDSTPAVHAELLLDGRRVGVVTSAVRSPLLKKGIGLGYVRNAQAEPGIVLAVESEGHDIAVKVVELPFNSAASASAQAG